MSLFFNMLGFGSINYTVTVSGEVISNIDSPGPVLVGVRFNSDGTIDRNDDGSYGQIDSATDWIIPNAVASKKTYHVRATLNAQTGIGTRTGTLSSWLEIGVDTTEWTVEASSGSATWDLDIEISDDGGTSTIDTGLFELTATVI